MTILTRRSILQQPLVAAAAVALDRALPAQDTGTAPVVGVTKGRLKQAAVHWCYGGKLEDLAALAAKLGMTGIDVVHPKDWPILKKHGLVSTMAPCFEGGFGIGKGLNKKEHHEGHLEVLRARIDETAEAGFENVLVFSGNRESGLSDKDGLDNCAEALQQIVGHATDKGVVVQMEILNSKRDHKGYMCDSSRWAIDLVQKVGSDHFKILYDIYHVQIMEGDVIQTIRDQHEHFGHYHTAGVPGRGNLDSTQELNYPAICEAIVETGYKGILGQEFLPKGDKVQALTSAVDLCDV